MHFSFILDFFEDKMENVNFIIESRLETPLNSRNHLQLSIYYYNYLLNHGGMHFPNNE